MNNINSTFGIADTWNCPQCGTENKANETVCRLCGMRSSIPDSDPNTDKAEKTLSTIASIILWTGVIASAILIVGGIAELTDDNEVLGTSLLLAGLYILPSSVLSWGLLKVISNISLTLKQINSKLKN